MWNQTPLNHLYPSMEPAYASFMCTWPLLLHKLLCTGLTEISVPVLQMSKNI